MRQLLSSSLDTIVGVGIVLAVLAAAWSHSVPLSIVAAGLLAVAVVKVAAERRRHRA